MYENICDVQPHTDHFVPLGITGKNTPCSDGCDEKYSSAAFLRCRLANPLVGAAGMYPSEGHWGPSNTFSPNSQRESSSRARHARGRCMLQLLKGKIPQSPDLSKATQPVLSSPLNPPPPGTTILIRAAYYSHLKSSLLREKVQTYPSRSGGVM